MIWFDECDCCIEKIEMNSVYEVTIYIPETDIPNFKTIFGFVERIVPTVTMINVVIGGMTTLKFEKEIPAPAIATPPCEFGSSTIDLMYQDNSDSITDYVVEPEEPIRLEGNNMIIDMKFMDGLLSKVFGNDVLPR